MLAVATMVEQWRILVVEDEENLNRNIVNTLQKDGYFVHGVTSGAEAIRLLWGEECDIVICSQHMPDADGFDLLQWMRTYCPNARMVMLALPGTAGNRTQALEMGVSSYLEKPVDMRTLKEELRRLLHQTGFSASLDSFDLLDVIQIITMSRKSIALVVSIGLEEEGVLHFQNGELIWAEYGTLRGEEAFFALAAHKNGTVVHRPWSEQITPNVTQPLSRLIFQALQYRSKYAEYQQLSSEQEAIRPANLASGTPMLHPSPPTTTPDALQDLEEDDRPFQFVAEDIPVGVAPGGTNFEPFLSGGNPSGPPSEAPGGFIGAARNGDQELMQESESTKEWWEPTGTFPRARAGDIQTITDEAQAGSQQPGKMNITPSTVRQPAPLPNNGLPSWLTDQPTYLDLPVLRGNTGQMPAQPSSAMPAVRPNGAQPPFPLGNQSSPMPAVRPNNAQIPGQSSPMPAVRPNSAQTPIQPRGQSAAMPAVRPNSSSMPIPGEQRPPIISPPPGISPLPPIAAISPTPAIPGQPSTFGLDQPEVPQSPLPGLSPSESGLRKIKLDEALYTGPQRAIKPGTANSPIPAEWQSPGPVLPGNQHGPTGPVTFPSQVGELQSLAALKKNSAPLVPSPETPLTENLARPVTTPIKIAQEVIAPQTNGARNGSQPLPTGEKTSRRNYPALAAALQTLGYSVPGFIASAIVSIDGTPIAQVAVDELDISSMCAHLSSVIRGTMQALEQEHLENYEHTVITSHNRHILLRIIGSKKDVFQVLLTTRETNPTESLEVMANVEAAIATALH